jgi:hypothetical protein
MPETVETSQNTPAITPKRRYRRFRGSDIEDVAKLMAKGNTEAEACELLGIPLRSFQHFKSKASRNSMFDAHFNRARGGIVNECVETMLEAGRRVNPKTGCVDWRAHQAVLQTVVRDRFGHDGPQVNVQVGIMQQLAPDVDKVLERIWSQPVPAKQVTGEQMRQLPKPE